MRKTVFVLLILGLFCLSAFAQTGKKTRPRIVKTPTSTPQTQTQRPVLQNDTQNKTTQQVGKPPVLVDNTSKKPPSTKDQVPADEEVLEDDEIIKVDTNFVTLPVSVLDRQGRFISGLTQNQFQIFDNGIQQKVEYFASVEKPFTVVLMIDVSPSTQYKIDEIQDAAITFVNQLRPDDRVMVVAFDRRLQVLSQPTNNRMQLRNAIRRANFGDGTSLYDSIDQVINRYLRNIEGRKAIVLFTDGVDTTSNNANYQTTLRNVEEVDALIYPVRYDTSSQYAQTSYPGSRRIPQSTGSVLGDILATIMTGNVSIGGVGGAGQSPADYARGKAYLEELARFSGGRKFEANTTYNLDAAFRSIAEELRRQYSLGYYPEAVGQKGERRQIRVRIKRPNLVVRTKRSYIVGDGN
ncbi:MAG: VWA domain-containing protein [Acidobacteriota bacterium]|jgi:VWFA-related protein|nr:VWA domain-containing protein [Acidobacteriota bacterium]